MPSLDARRTLTDKGIQRLRPQPGKRLQVFDAVVPGLCVRVTEKGAKSFALVTRHNGKQRWITLGKHGALSLAQARDRAREALLLAKSGQDPSPPRSMPADDALATVIPVFIERYAKPKNRSWKETERIFERYVLPEWGGRRVGEITRQDAVALIDQVVDRNGPYMANRVLAAVRKFFNWSLERGLIEATPLARVRVPGKEIQRDRVLSDDEVVRLWRAWDQQGPVFGPMFKMLLITAQRRGEVAGMRWQDIDMEQRLWTLPRELTKSDRKHEVPLTDLTLGILQEMPRLHDEYVFAGLTRSGNPVSGISKAKARTDVLSGLTDWRVHDLRRTAGTNMAKLGVSTHVIAWVLNHSSDHGVTGIYDRHSYALELWSNRLGVLGAE